MSDTVVPRELLDLGVALGFLCPDSLEVCPEWFDPSSGVMSQALSNPDQRAAVVALAQRLFDVATDEFDLPRIGDDEEWIPIAVTGSGAQTAGVFVILTVEGDDPVLALGARAAAVPDPALATSLTLRLPLVKLAPDGPQLLLGGADGRPVEVAATASFTPPLQVAGVLTLAGVSLAATVPSAQNAPSDETSLGVVLRGLQLAGDSAPRDVRLAALLDDLDGETLRLLLALVRSQSLPQSVDDLLQFLGLGDDPAIPNLPVEDLFTQGTAALQAWLRDEIFSTAPALQAWLRRLRSFATGTQAAVPGSGTAADPFRIDLATGSLEVALTLTALPEAQSGNLSVTPGLRVRAAAPAASPTGGGLQGDVAFATFTLGPSLAVSPLPALRAYAELGDGAGTLVNTPGPPLAISVGRLRLGATLDADGKLAALLELVDADVGADHYDTLDLNSADAVTGAVGSVADSLLDDLLGIANNSAARSLAALAGLVAPAGAAAGGPQLTSLPAFFADPLGAIACYHARVLADGSWNLLAAELGGLLRDAGGPAVVVSGDGTEAVPWSITLFDNEASNDPVRGKVRLLAWSPLADGGGPRLHLAVRIEPLVPPIDGKDLDVAYTAELLRAVLPPATVCPAPIDVVWVGDHMLTAKLSPDLSLIADSVTVHADSIRARLRWNRVDGLRADYAIVDPRLEADGVTVDLPDFDLDWVPDLPTLPWPQIQLLFGDWLSGGDGWQLRLGQLFGWLPRLGDLQVRLPSLPDLDLRFPSLQLPTLSLPDLFGNPFAGLLAWLRSLFSGGGGGFDFSLPGLGWLSSLFAGFGGGGAPLEVHASGNGTYADPWAIRVGAGSGRPELLLWLDPDGPTLAGFGDLTAHLVPSGLTGPLDGGAGALPDLQQLSGFLQRAGSLVPQLRDALGEIDDLPAALAALRTRIADGDGLVAAADQRGPTGWTEMTIAQPTAHLLEPAAFTLPPAVAAAVPAERRIFVSTDLPLLAAWPDQGAGSVVIDLTEKGVPPEAFDLSSHTGPGPWFVRLPRRSDAVVPAEPNVSGFDRLVARLRRAVAHVRTVTGGDVVVIAHSTAGQVARVLASAPAAQTGILHVVTVGTPHGGSTFEFLDDAGTGDALRLLQRLRRLLDDGVATAADVKPLDDLLKGLTAVLDDYRPGAGGLPEHVPFPVEDFTPPAVYPVLGAGTQGHAVVGRVAAAELDRAVAALVRRVLERAVGLLPAGGTITHLGLGLRLPFAAGSTVAGEVSAAGTLRLDLHRFELQAGGADRPTPRAIARLELRRNGGWLVGGPRPGHTLGMPRDPRARWAEAEMSLNLKPNPNPDDADVRVTLHDASVFGIVRDLWTVDESAVLAGDVEAELTPAARVLLGEIAAEIGQLPATGTLREVAELLSSLALIEIAADGRVALAPDPLERFLVDPLGELRARLAAATPSRAAVLAALRQLLGLPATGSPQVLSLGDDFELEVALQPAAPEEAPAVSLRTNTAGLVLANGPRLELSLTAGLDGSLRGSGSLSSTTPAGPAGRPAVEVTGDSSATEKLSVRLVTADSSLSVLADAIELFPNADAAALVRRLAAYLPGELLRIALTWARSQAPARLDALYGLLALKLDPAPNARLRNLAGLLGDARGWLSSQAAFGAATAAGAAAAAAPSLDAARVSALFDALRSVTGVTGNAGRLPLPWGVELVASATGTSQARLAVTRPGPIAAGGVEVTAGLALVVSSGLEVKPELDVLVRLTDPPGLDHLELDLDAGEVVGLVLRVQPAAGSEVTVTLLPSLGGVQGLVGLATNAAVQQVLPLALDALAGLANPVGQGVGGLGDALGLRTGGNFVADELRSLAADPSAFLVSRLRSEATSAVAALRGLLAGQVLDTSGLQVLDAGRTLRLTSGVVSASLQIPATGPVRLCVELDSLRPIPGLRLDVHLCVDPTGLAGLSVAAEVDDPNLLRAGSVELFPAATVVTGSFAVAGGDRVEVGLWLDDTPADREGIFVLLPFGGAASAVCREVVAGSASDGSVANCADAVLQYWLVPLAVDLLLEVPEVTAFLGAAADAGTVASRLVASQILVDAGQLRLDPGFLDDIVSRLLRLGGEVAGAAPPLPLPGVDLTFAEQPAGDSRTRFGLQLSLPQPLELFSADGLRLSLVSDDFLSPGTGGVTVFFLSLADAGDPDPHFAPSIRIGGLGLLADEPQGGPLIDLVASVQSIALHGAFGHDGNAVDLAAGAVALNNLTIPLGRGDDGDNPVASKIMSPGEESDAGDAAELAPALSPRLILRAVPDPGVELSLGLELPQWVPIQKSFGPFYVEQVGLDDEERNGELERVVFLVDGGITLAGLNVGVDDLAIRIPWRSPHVLDTWRVDLAGLAISFESGSVSVTGGFRKSQDTNDYSGILQVQVDPYGLTAVGAYGVFDDPTRPGDKYTSLFVFAALNAPLGGPPPFFVVGLGGGIGLNRRLLLPADVTALPGFPLMAAMDESSGFSDNPLGALVSVASSFPPQRGTFWLAAGVRFTSFSLIESIAVLALEIGDGVEIALLGLSRAELPDPDFPLAAIELVLRARFSSREGILGVEAQLTDNSWILSPSCRLTGGFAFYIFFRQSDFVFTLGGYHPKFNKPAHYPDVPRLGYHWDVSGALVIKGESYFALTSSCVMAGQRLEASFTTSVVWASFVGGFDALISWDPFFYDVQAYVRISAGIRIRICFFGCFTLKLSFSLGARVHIEGPELRGEVTVELGPIEITVGFGPAPSAKDEPLPWSTFREKYLIQGNPDGETMSAGIATGLIGPDPGSRSEQADDGSQQRPWRVAPEFTFTTETRMPSTEVVVQNRRETLNGADVIDLGPMKIVDVESRHRIRIERLGPDDPGDVDLDFLTFEGVKGRVPDGAWRYVKREDRAPSASFLERTLLGGRFVAQVRAPDDDVRVRLLQVNPSTTPHPLPFHQERADRARFTSRVSAAESYLGSRPTATSEVLEAGAGSTLSTVGRRLFAADRVAPPRLAPLTEGMVSDVKPPVELTFVPPEPARPLPDASILPPRLRGVLRGNAAPEVRPALRTTVTRRTLASSDAQGASTAGSPGRFERVEMPSLAAVETSRRHFGARLVRTAAPLRQAEGTVVSRGDGPRTSFAGGLFEVQRGFRLSSAQRKSIRAVEHELQNGGVTLAAGDVVLLELPNAVRDRNERRPRLEIAGDQTVRVVILDRAGWPLTDVRRANGAVTVPTGADRIALAGQGMVPEDGTSSGLAGWHETQRLGQIDSNTFLGHDAVIVGSAPRTFRRTSGTNVAQVSARRAAAGPSVATQLPADSRSVLLAVETTAAGDAVARLFDNLSLGIAGARRRSGADGRALPPQVVVTANRVYGVFDVEPDAGPDAGAQAITVTVAANASFRITGVAGCPADAEDLAADVLERGLETLFDRGAMNPIGDSRIAWRPAEEGEYAA